MNDSTLGFITQKLLDMKEQVNMNTTVMGNFNTPVLQTGQSDKNVSKETSELIRTIEKKWTQQISIGCFNQQQQNSHQYQQLTKLSSKWTYFSP